MNNASIKKKRYLVKRAFTLLSAKKNGECEESPIISKYILNARKTKSVMQKKAKKNSFVWFKKKIIQN